jgi:hypothetical protein
VTMKQRYNEDILINNKYKQSIFRKQIKYIEFARNFNQMLKKDIFDNTSITHHNVNIRL